MGCGGLGVAHGHLVGFGLEFSQPDLAAFFMGRTSGACAVFAFGMVGNASAAFG